MPEVSRPARMFPHVPQQRSGTYLAAHPLSHLLRLRVMGVCVYPAWKNLSPEGFRLPFVL